MQVIVNTVESHVKQMYFKKKANEMTRKEKNIKAVSAALLKTIKT